MKFCVFFTFFFLIERHNFANGENRIAGGNTVEIQQYPFAVALLTNGGSGTVFQQACGGSILTVNAILSAASCLYFDYQANQLINWRARVGSTYYSRGGTLHFIRRVDSHPEFSTATLVNDIAILRTTVNIELQTGVVEVAKIVGGAFTLSNQQPVWAIGWGATTNGGEPSEQLREVQFWVVDWQTCANRYAELSYTLNNNVVCTGWLDVGVRGQCVGDAGSPVVENGAVVAVHSYAEGCAQGWYPGVNTQVAPFSRWIVATALAA